MLIAGVWYWIYSGTEMPAKEWLLAYLGTTTVLSLLAGMRILVAYELYQLSVLLLYSAVGLVTPLLLVGFATAYIGRNPWTDPVVQAFVLGLIPILVLLVTSPIHDYHFGIVTIHQTPFPHYESAGSIGRWSAIVYALLAYIVVIYYFLVLFLKSRHRPSLAILVFALGFGISFAIVFASELGVVPVQTYDHMPFGIGIQAVAIAYAAFRLGLQDIGPIARDELVESLGDPFFALDSQYRLLDYNAASKRLIARMGDGRNAELDAEHIGVAITEIIPELSKSLTDEGGDTRVTLTVEGEQRHYSLNTSTVTDWRDVRGYVIILRDITSLVQSQRRIEQQNEQLDQFVSVISHDLQNPLMTAQGYLELAQDTGDIEHLGKVEQAHQRMAQMITELLQIARADVAVENTEPVPLATFAKQSWDPIDTAGANLMVAVEPTVTIAANPELLRRLLENLFDNAITHNELPIQVTVGTLGEEPLSGFYVADDGDGISTADAGDLFESGYTTADNGTGLGLAIVQQVAAAHDWEIAVTEVTYGGARFEITGVSGDVDTDLPLADEYVSD